MSQVAAKKRIIISNEHVIVKGHFHEQGSVLRGDAEGFCDGFEVEISLDSKESDAAIAELIMLARKMCFTEKALMGNTPITVTQSLNGKMLEVS